MGAHLVFAHFTMFKWPFQKLPPTRDQKSTNWITDFVLGWFSLPSAMGDESHSHMQCNMWFQCNDFCSNPWQISGGSWTWSAFLLGDFLHPGRLTWNLQITNLERKTIWTKPSRLCSMLIFRGVSLDSFCQMQNFNLSLADFQKMRPWCH